MEIFMMTQSYWFFLFDFVFKESMVREVSLVLECKCKYKVRSQGL